MDARFATLAGIPDASHAVSLPRYANSDLCGEVVDGLEVQFSSLFNDNSEWDETICAAIDAYRHVFTKSPTGSPTRPTVEPPQTATSLCSCDEGYGNSLSRKDSLCVSPGGTLILRAEDGEERCVTETVNFCVVEPENDSGSHSGTDESVCDEEELEDFEADWMAISDDPDLPADDVGPQHYQRQFVIGTGAFCKVWKAINPQTQVSVAIKAVSRLPRHRLTPGSDELDEASCLRQLVHPNIVILFETISIPGAVEGLVFEYMCGSDLCNALDDDEVDRDECKHYMRQVRRLHSRAHPPAPTFRFRPRRHHSVAHPLYFCIVLLWAVCRSPTP
jgi:hypothetical protein